MNNIKKSAKKWYDFLAFPKEFDALFDKMLKREDISDEILSKSYTELNDAGDYEINLIYSLAKCDDLKLKYKQASINDQIFADTIADIKVRSLICYEYTNILGIDLILWIANHLDLKLFKLGRLQFNFSPSIVDCPEAGLKEGDNTIGVHIPKDEPFTPELWEKSFSMANEFFAKHFPEYEYKYFSCSSWFLSPDLDILLNEGSNILKFKKLFNIVSVTEKDIMLSFVFSWGATVSDIDKFEAKTSLQKKIKEYIAEGNTLHSGYGIIEKRALCQ